MSFHLHVPFFFVNNPLNPVSAACMSMSKTTSGHPPIHPKYLLLPDSHQFPAAPQVEAEPHDPLPKSMLELLTGLFLWTLVLLLKRINKFFSNESISEWRNLACTPSASWVATKNKAHFPEAVLFFTVASDPKSKCLGKREDDYLYSLLGSQLGIQTSTGPKRRTCLYEPIR